MEKIKVTICGREFNLVTDDAPEDIRIIAEKLEEKIVEFSKTKIRSDEEMLTLIALNVLNEAEKDMFAVKNVIGEMHKRISALEEENSDLKSAEQLTISENLKSATRELEQIAQVRDEENEQLRKRIVEYERNAEHLAKEREIEIMRLKDGFESAQSEMANIAGQTDEINEQLRGKILDYEQQIEALMKDREVEIKRLHDGFDSASKEMAHIAGVRENENNTLRNTLSTYEATFDNYVKLKEEEIVKLRGMLENVQLEYATLKSKLSDGNSGGQLTFYS
ncbi:MAG: hypothetical protein LBC82_08395 [Oscillospiraceae bacterium]|jgi:chromosome segregation ATPase|nr:hypothetical protein [Oscillospiraceae bacterium]